MREDIVRLPNGSADLRFRGEMFPWSADLSIRYNAGIITPEQVINLVNLAGFHVGVGEWRPGSPKKTGSFGMFHAAGGKA